MSVSPRVQTKSAGRELDAEIAERVMGAEWRTTRRSGYAWLMMPDAKPTQWLARERGDLFEPRSALAFYSTDIASAFLVLAKMRELGKASLRLAREWDRSAQQVLRWAHKYDAEQVAAAICLAALAALDASSPAKAAVHDPETSVSAASVSDTREERT